MKIVFNTAQPNAACSLFYRQGFEGMPGMSFYKTDFANYDIALFMTYDHALMQTVKKDFPHLKIGLIDPRSEAVLPSLPYCDFLVVDSIEMEDYWRLAKKPIARYVEYPKIPIDLPLQAQISALRDSRDKETIYIGYHGNAYHIIEGENSVLPAISKLADKHKIELLLMHNNPSDKAHYDKVMPKNVKSKRVNWSMENYIRFLALSDIGIVPNNLGATPKISATTGDPRTDYCLSFKMSSNPGRFAVFGLLGLPVVADFYPSSLQYLQNDCGLVAHSESGWYHCLETLIESPSLRQKMGSNLKNLVETQFGFEAQNEKFLTFLKDL
jgi:glycosyltransferase involved in cell wall biosynthesis